ncbi:hypothetical protein [Secundilactobacillus kimchicus]|uniref:hypothetical protein n=1 Tax=Secundilactobacillus kimchicus TaxID=528209 RepID=UPI000A94035F|nr:hypothetical protein [Secundilactobacillus kimchicus]
MPTREPQNMQDYVLSGRPILHHANSMMGPLGYLKTLPSLMTMFFFTTKILETSVSQAT